MRLSVSIVVFFFFQAEDGIRDSSVTGVQTCALPILEVVGAQTFFHFCKAMASFFYVGILKKKYKHRKKKMMSGDHPESCGGSCPTLPMASRSADMSHYTTPMPAPRATPPSAPLLP